MINIAQAEYSADRRIQPVHSEIPQLPQVAVYWDFENIHAAVLEEKEGEGTYRRVFNEIQDPVVKIGAIVRYVSGLGTIAINRAYANWERFSSYRLALLEHSIDLIQIFPPGGKAKNGADIRLAIDVIQDILVFPHITTVVIISGDSDYISLVQRCKQQGRDVFGIGVQRAASQFLIKSCNEFKFYHTLFDDARQLLVTTLHTLLRVEGKEHVLKARVRPAMTRMDPDFDEANYGFSSFVEFLDQCRDLVCISQGENDHLISISREGYKLVGEDERREPGKLMLFQKKEPVTEFEDEDIEELFVDHFPVRRAL